MSLLDVKVHSNNIDYGLGKRPRHILKINKIEYGLYKRVNIT